MTKNNLSELNTILQDITLDLPTHRRLVGKSGSNLSWLRSKILPNVTNTRLKELLTMHDKELLE
jgi:hypothetical protein